MANKACAKKILDCSEELIMNARCLQQLTWLRGGVLGDEETAQAGEYLVEAVKLQKKAAELLAASLE